MGTVEVLPDLLVSEQGSRTLGGGAVSTLAALNDASDTTYIQAAGTLSQKWSGVFRFANPVIPAGATIRHVQLKHRFSHNTSATPGHERFQPITVLVGRQSGTRHVYDLYATGERFTVYSLTTSPRDATFPARNKGYDGRFFIGERFQTQPSRRLYGSLTVERRIANNSARAYSFSLVVTYDEKPVVTLNQPSGTEVIARPPFEWGFADPEGSAQEVFDARIYTQDMANDAEFDVENLTLWPPEYRFVGTSPKTGHDLVAGFGEDGGAYRAYLRARTAYIWSPGVNYTPFGSSTFLSPLSDWDTSDFTLDIATPRVPLVTATYDSVSHGIEVEVEGLDNVLEHNETTFEDGVADYVGGTNTTLFHETTIALHGNDSMRLTRTTSVGDATASTVDNFPVIGGEMYSAQAWFRAATTGRVCRITVLFVDEMNQLVGASSSFHDVTDATGIWRQALAWGTAPANAVKAGVFLTVTGAGVGEQHYVDQVGVFPGLRTQMLTENQSDLESGTTGWAAGASSSIAQNLVQFYRNKASLAITRNTSTGTGSATTPTGTSGVRVNASTQYTAAARFRAATAGRQCRLLINWYDAAGALLTTATGANFLDTTTGWTQATVTATSHASAVFAAVVLECQSALATEVHYVDTVVLNPGPTAGEIAPWNEGGFLHDDPGTHVIELQRSLEVDEHGFPIWETIPEPRVVHVPRHQSLTYVDYEVPSLETATYRARIEAENHEGDMLNSGWSNLATAVMAVFDSWWLRDPLNPGELTMRIRVVSAQLVTPKPNTTDYPVGADAAVMTHDGVKQDVVRTTVDLLNEADYDMFRMMIDSGATLLLQDVHGRQWYVQADDGIEYEVLRAVKLPSEPWPTRHSHRVTVDFVSVEKPRSLAVAATHGHA